MNHTSFLSRCIRRCNLRTSLGNRIVQSQSTSTTILSTRNWSASASGNRDREVKLVEVGPRDGLQNEPKIISPDRKIKLVQKLVDAGCKNIETASFVSPKWVPAMADAKEVVTGLHNWRMSMSAAMSMSTPKLYRDVTFSVLTPNEQGMKDALSCGKGAVDEIAIFAAASETFSHKNLGCSIESSMKRFDKVVEMAKGHDIPIRGYVSCVLGCPYEGTIEKSDVARVSERLAQLGCHEISLGDTIGVGTPEQTIQMLNEVLIGIDKEMIAVHFHDTYGQALANIYAALGTGIRTIDSSVAGLGGCPYASGASGNVATEDVVYMLNGMNMDCGIDLQKLIHASEYILSELGKNSNSKCGRALMTKTKNE